MRIRRRIVWGLLLLIFLGVAGAVGGFYATGYRAYIIHTGSMVPDLVPGDLIIDRPADRNYRVGDVITFRHGPTPDLVTHRIVQITPVGIHTKGDANRTADVWTIPRPYVEGVVRWTLPGFGYAVVFLKQPTGLASIVVMLIGLVLLWQLFFPAEPEPDQSAPPSAAGAEPDATPDEPQVDGHHDPVRHEPVGTDGPPGTGRHRMGAIDSVDPGDSFGLGDLGDLETMDDTDRLAGLEDLADPAGKRALPDGARRAMAALQSR